MGEVWVLLQTRVITHKELSLPQQMGRGISWLMAVKLFVSHVCKAVKDLNRGWSSLPDSL